MSAAARLNSLLVLDLDGFPDTPEDYTEYRLFLAGRLPARLNPAHVGWMREHTGERAAEWQAPRIAGHAVVAARPAH